MMTGKEFLAFVDAHREEIANSNSVFSRTDCGVDGIDFLEIVDDEDEYNESLDYGEVESGDLCINIDLPKRS